MPPLHVHREDDETLFVLDGSLTLLQPGGEVSLGPGDAFRAERGIPHVYRVESETARWLAFTEPAGFADLVREVSEPAPAAEIPPAGRRHDVDVLAAAAARHGIELLGPPGTLP
jgi:hypothetical protein